MKVPLEKVRWKLVVIISLILVVVFSIIMGWEKIAYVMVGVIIATFVAVRWLRNRNSEKILSPFSMASGNGPSSGPTSPAPPLSPAVSNPPAQTPPPTAQTQNVPPPASPAGTGDQPPVSPPVPSPTAVLVGGARVPPQIPPTHVIDDEDEEEDEDDEHSDHKTPLGFYRVLVIVINTILGIVALGIIYSSEGPITWESFIGIHRPLLGALLFIANALYVLESFQTVEFGYEGLLLLFDGYYSTEEDGLVYAPPFFFKVRAVPITNIQIELPADPEDVYYGDPTKNADGKVPDGLYAAAYITSAPCQGDVTVNFKDGRQVIIPANNAYNFQQTWRLQLPLTYKVCKWKAKNFIGTVHTFEEAERQMGDVALRVCASVFPRMTAAEANLRLEEVGVMVKKKLQILTRPWGIKIVDVGIKAPGFSHDLNSAVGKVSIAQMNKETTITDSEAEREKLRNHGLGNADALAELLFAQAEGYQRQKEIADSESGRFAMTLGTANEVAKNRNFAVVGSGNPIGDLLGMREVWNHLGSNPLVPSVPSQITAAPDQQVPAVTPPTTETDQSQNSGRSQQPPQRKKGGKRRYKK